MESWLFRPEGRTQGVRPWLMIPNRDTATGSRFWGQLAISSSGCWMWLGLLDRKGYGKFYFRGYRWRLHRLVWTWVNGLIPKNKQVCHHCDIPYCCNPKHLFLGTALENSQDAVRKDRTCHGEKNHFAKLSFNDVLGILERFHLGSSRRSISEEFGISYSHTVQIINGRKWRRLHGKT